MADSGFSGVFKRAKDPLKKKLRAFAANIILSNQKEKEPVDILWSLDVKEAVTLVTSKYVEESMEIFQGIYILNM